jgi:hypothetical protein
MMVEHLRWKTNKHSALLVKLGQLLKYFYSTTTTNWSNSRGYEVVVLNRRAYIIKHPIQKQNFELRNCVRHIIGCHWSLPHYC